MYGSAPTAPNQLSVRPTHTNVASSLFAAPHPTPFAAGVTQDQARAAKLYGRAAAATGNATAANNLAKMLLDSRADLAMLRDLADTTLGPVLWPAQAGGAQGAGMMALQVGVEQGSAAAAAAARLFEMAADQGSVSAWYNLGVCHHDGIGAFGGRGGVRATPGEVAAAGAVL